LQAISASESSLDRLGKTGIVSDRLQGVLVWENGDVRRKRMKSRGNVETIERGFCSEPIVIRGFGDSLRGQILDRSFKDRRGGKKARDRGRG
jgi:hypothetical protein